jgi:hypothetical protein
MHLRVAVPALLALMGMVLTGQQLQVIPCPVQVPTVDSLLPDYWDRQCRVSGCTPSITMVDRRVGGSAPVASLLYQHGESQQGLVNFW